VSPRPRAFLIDDEPLALKRLERMLVETGRVEIAGKSTDPAQALQEVATLRPTVLFLDIEMPGINGFEFVSSLPYEPNIVFTTAYDQYALKAFEVSSIDYLLKPIEPEDLARALTKLERQGSAGWEHVRALLAELSNAPAPLQRIASRVGQRVKFVDLVRISHFTADDKLTFALTDEGSHVIDMTLTELENSLDSRRFQRIHRATLVNLDYVVELYGSFAGSFRVRLKNRQQSDLKVSRERIQALREKLGVAAARPQLPS
jgi:two-component system, LytTR family, response regulator